MNLFKSSLFKSHRYSAVLFSLVFSCLSSWGFELPNAFVVKEKFWAIGNDFEIYSADKKDTYLGKIEQRIWNLTTVFELKDAKGELVAKAKSRFWALGSTIDVTDAQGVKIGTVKEDILKSLFKVVTTYTVLDAKGKSLGTSEKLEVFSTKVSVLDSTGKQVFLTKRPMINLITDKWETTISNRGGIDLRLLVFIPAYKTAADNYRRSSSSSSD
jgi:uncharacterized protein YxjI